MKQFLLLILFATVVSYECYATCLPGQTEIIIQIIPDGFPNETSWTLADSSGNFIAIGASTGDTVCVPAGSCLMFRIFDAYGDGIFSPGGYWVYMDGVQVASGAGFGSEADHALNCPAGMHCTNPTPITAGNYTTSYDNDWYIFTPTITGTYNISTCDSNTCNTKIWVYTNCPVIPYDEGPPGTYSYNDDNNCGTQANLNVTFIANTTYFIRIGDNLNSCTGHVNFTLSFVGAVQGCMDPLACNYNPLAMVDDGSCIYYPNPGCTGPDLQLDSVTFLQSLSLSTTTAMTCDVDEGCLTGYGTRYILSFSSKINNIGTLDFYIGNPSSNPGMFNTNNCHHHAHYEGYGDYRLFDSNGNLVPAGHKNGFCVMDLCGFGHYNCGDMGISVGCYDEYGAGTQCQSLDITDVPAGDYRMAAIINSHHLPDALGHYESNYLNNALQICLHISRSGSGIPSYTILPACSPFVDCAGVPGGAGESDCSGICNGPGVFGDAFSDGTLDSEDVTTYLDIIQAQFPPSTCYDLNADARISVYDAALVNWCLHGNNSHPGGSFHNHCHFPRNIVNPSDSVGLSISSVNFTDNYVDIAIKNPSAAIQAYQFNMSGIHISSVVSLANPVLFPVDLRFVPATNAVFAVSVQDSGLHRSLVEQALVRVYFDAVTDTSICISSITDLINQDAEQTIHYIYNNCQSSVLTSISSVLKPAGLVIMPNPANHQAWINLPENINLETQIKIVDASGRMVMIPIQNIRDNWYEMDLSKLPSGVYFVTVKNEKEFGVARFVKM